MTTPPAVYGQKKTGSSSCSTAHSRGHAPKPISFSTMPGIMWRMDDFDRIQVIALTVVVPLASMAVLLWLARRAPVLDLGVFGRRHCKRDSWRDDTLFDRWAWKQPWLQGWFVKRPILKGDWTFCDPFALDSIR